MERVGEGSRGLLVWAYHYPYRRRHTGGMGSYPYRGMGGMPVRVVVDSRGMGHGMTILRDGLVIILEFT